MSRSTLQPYRSAVNYPKDKITDKTLCAARVRRLQKITQADYDHLLRIVYVTWNLLLCYTARRF